MSKKTFEQHQMYDRQQRLNESLLRAQEALDNEDKTIADYVVNLTLNNTAVNTSAFTIPISAPDLVNSSPTSHAQTTDRAFSSRSDTLAMVQKDLSVLNLKLHSLIETLLPPSSKSDVFPLTPLHEEALQLDDRLSSLVVRGNNGIRSKCDARSQLASIQRSIQEARKVWNTQSARFADPTPSTMVYESGMFLVLYLDAL